MNSLTVKKISALFIVGVLLFSDARAKGYPEFPYSKNMDVVIVADNMDFNGLEMRAYQFKSKDDEEDIVAFYESEWGDEMTNVLFGDWRILSHREGDYLMTVQIEQNTMAVTHGTLGITPMFRLVDAGSAHIKKLQSGIGKDFPTPPKSKILNDIKSDDGGIVTRTLLFENAQSVRQNLRFYLRSMQSDGWQVLGGTPENIKDVNVLAMNKGGRKLNLSFVSRDGKTYGVATSIN
ncbi:hypothetical protein GCM10008090_03460 [Arenicella chitinivorans]|uniref:Uncharacterized protein n=1 Tax=Arenicella chitinivorans TaxID=1329800 RepID=A0A918RJ47_9GAMM|nr:hypothetical protein [Arenicella chitinivorans]GGZ98335.1 hypothetical protein GCM10008090_03460 [Arenicella chitinivorans]